MGEKPEGSWVDFEAYAAKYPLEMGPGAVFKREDLKDSVKELGGTVIHRAFNHHVPVGVVMAAGDDKDGIKVAGKVHKDCLGSGHFEVGGLVKRFSGGKITDFKVTEVSWVPDWEQSGS